MQIPRTAFFASAFLAGLAVLGSACTLDKKKLEDAIAEECKSKGLPLKSVACPDGVKAKKGENFDCTGETEEGDKVAFHVTQTDPGNLTWKLDGQIVDESAVAASLDKRITDDVHAASSVKCPKKTTVLPADESFTCDVTIGADTKKVDVTIDKDGNPAYAIK